MIRHECCAFAREREGYLPAPRLTQKFDCELDHRQVSQEDPSNNYSNKQIKSLEKAINKSHENAI